MVFINIIEWIQAKYWRWQYKNYQKDIDDTYEHIWGLKSYDDLSSSECNYHTMNDIDITYNKKDKYYFMSIETIYQFKKGRDGEREYIKRLFDKLTEWMISKGYDTSQEVYIYDVFTEGNNINTHFDSLEELYTNFKFLVNGFVNSQKQETL